MPRDGEKAKLLKQIAKSYKDGVTWKELAKKYKVGFKTISTALKSTKTERRNATAEKSRGAGCEQVAIKADLLRALVDNVVEAAEGRPVQSIHINVVTGSVVIAYIENKVLNFKR